MNTIKRIYLPLFIVLLLTGCVSNNLDKLPEPPEDYVQVSIDLLQAARYDANPQPLMDKLANADPKLLAKSLDTHERRLAFWINIYNAYIQHILKAEPELYEARNAFFTDPRFTIAGEEMSFDDVENGMIRKSTIKISLGFLRDPFPGKFERLLRVDEKDPRIHFALNCGAKSCPPVAIYSPDRLNEQLNIGTQQYLIETTTYDAVADTAEVTSLFSWFRGDFGGLKGAKKMLQRYRAIPQEATPKLKFKYYDWTLDLDNYIDL